MKLNDSFVIINVDSEPGENLFWNNELGWVDASDADVFSREEKHGFDLPISGDWRKLSLFIK
jgi:hypothetical protein